MSQPSAADIIAQRPDRKLWLIDLKTSKGSKWWPYPEVFGQVTAYAAMYEEVSADHVIDQIHVWRIGKEEGDAGQVYRLSEREREIGLELFRSARTAYEIRKELSCG